MRGNPTQSAKSIYLRTVPHQAEPDKRVLNRFHQHFRPH